MLSKRILNKSIFKARTIPNSYLKQTSLFRTFMIFNRNTKSKLFMMTNKERFMINQWGVRGF